MDVNDHLQLVGVPEGTAFNGSLAGDQDEGSFVLQPLWGLVLANRYYTASPLWPIFIANTFYFVCMIPYIILDFYGLDHWSWVKRYKIYPQVRVTWSQARHCLSLTMWNQLLFILPISVVQWVWTPDSVLPRHPPPLFEFIWQQYVALAIFDAFFFSQATRSGLR
jgi:cholesterol 25-hydroxylase